jgi:hypothetical protein
MHTGRYGLSQIIELVERKTLSRLVARYGAEERVRHFKCRQQFICMVFAQMTSRDGLRDIATCINARPETLYHLGFTEKVAKSTLAEANENRDWRIWIAVCTYLMIAILHRQLKLPGTLHRTLQVLSVHPFEKVTLKEPLTETDHRTFINSDPNQLNLF